MEIEFKQFPNFSRTIAVATIRVGWSQVICIQGSGETKREAIACIRKNARQAIKNIKQALDEK